MLSLFWTRRVKNLKFLALLAVPFKFVPRGEVIHYGKSIDITEWKEIIVVWRDDIWLLLLPEWSNISCALFYWSHSRVHRSTKHQHRAYRADKNADPKTMIKCERASERAYSNYTRRSAESVLVIMRARCQLAERQNNKRKRRPRHGTRPFYIAALLATAIFKFAGACWGEKLCRECIINLWWNFIASL